MGKLRRPGEAPELLRPPRPPRRKTREELERELEETNEGFWELDKALTLMQAEIEGYMVENKMLRQKLLDIENAHGVGTGIGTGYLAELRAEAKRKAEEQRKEDERAAHA